MRPRKFQPGVYMQLSSPDALRAWLKHRGYSYADLGRCVGISKQFVGQLATGEKKTCRPEVALLIEKVLLPPQELRGPGDLPLFVERTSKTNGGTSKTVVGATDTPK